MGSTSSTGSFGAGGTLDGMWQAMDEVRATIEGRLGQFGPSRGASGARADGRDDLRVAVLSLFGEKPMHGYQLIHEIAERSGGAWTPAAGAVYPTLQLLADEGLIRAAETDGRKVYSLTESGRAVADAEGDVRWADPSGSGAGAGSRDGSRLGDRRTALPKAGIALARATAQVGRTGSPEQIDQAVAVLEEARRRVYSILAQD